MPLDHVEALIDWLGPEHRAAVLACASTANHAGPWALGIIGLYGPTGTDRKAFVPEVDPNKSLAEPKRPEAVATAMLRFVGQGQRWDGKFFRGILNRVVSEELGVVNKATANGAGTGKTAGNPTGQGVNAKHWGRGKASNG